MIGRTVLLILSILGLGWIVYSSLEMVEKDKQFNPEYLFNESDQKVLIVNDLPAISGLITETGINTELSSFVLQWNTSVKGTLYLSKDRELLLFQAGSYFNKSLLSELFANPGDLEMTGHTDFKVHGFSGTIYRNWCILRKEKTPLNPTPITFIYDINSSGSVVDYSDRVSVTDIYFRESGMTEFKTAFDTRRAGTKVNDRDLFAPVISANISSYEFYEVDYLRHLDSVFYHGPMNEWVKTGIVIVDFKGSKAIVTDYLPGQDPIQSLFDHFGTTPETVDHAKFGGAALCRSLQSGNGFYAYNMDDFVVISTSAATCEGLIADYKLGNTIAHSHERSQDIYAELPLKVNHRLVNQTFKQSSSVYESHLLTTTYGGARSEGTSTSAPSMVSYAANEPIEDFFPISDDLLLILTKTRVIGFENKQKTWEHPINGTLVGKAQVIDLFANGHQQLLLATQKQLLLIDKNGQDVNGFPVALDDQTCTQQPAYYRWKGSGYFLVPVENGRVLEIDTKGRELDLIRTSVGALTIVPQVWASANQPFLGVYDGNRFEMIQLQTKRSFRTFDAAGMEATTQLPNEIILFGVHNNELTSYNQKGGRFTFGNIKGGKVVAVHQQGANPTIAVRAANVIYLYNSKGVEWASIRVPFNEIDRVGLHTLHDGSIAVSIVDGLENNVYLYKTSGQKLGSGKWEGSQKAVAISSQNGGLSLYTIVDNMVVRYK